MKQMSVAVIGAGMAGVGAARVMAEAGCRVVVFEKSRGLGGRCATKRWEGHLIDHGAQYFTIKNEEFSKAVRECCGTDLREISAPIVDETGRALPDGGRFFHALGNSRLARALGEGLEFRTGLGVADVNCRRISGEDFDVVISTAPWPQSAKLAGLSECKNPYAPCLALLLLYREEWLGVTEGLYAVSDRSGHALAWSACENHKFGRVGKGVTAMVVHASEKFSCERLEEDSVGWSEDLRRLVEERWEISPAALLAMHPHRWRYARMREKIEIPALPPGWFFVGDLLTESRVESAWLAGREAALQILNGASDRI